MKKLSKLFMLLTVCILMMSGCQQKEEETKEEKQAEALEIENKADDSEEKDDGEEQESEDTAQPEQQEASPETKPVTIYSPNENADGFVTSQAETTEVTESWVMEQLIAKGVVPGDVQVLSCTETQETGVNSLKLDLNQAFGTFLQSMGTAGEYVALGSVCNTFLDAYGCEQIQITVEGNTLATGHTEYPGYLTKFE